MPRTDQSASRNPRFSPIWGQFGANGPSPDNYNALLAKLGHFSPAFDNEGLYLFEDFMGAAASGLNPALAFTEGSGTGGAYSHLAAGAHALNLLTDDTAGTYAADGVQLTMAGLHLLGSKDITFRTRLRLDNIATVRLFLGLTDSIALEQSVSLDTATFTTVATDGLFGVFDTAATTDTWRTIGVANDVDTASVDVGAAPVAATYEEWEFNWRPDGSASVYRNGVLIQALAAASLRTNIPLSPIIGVVPTTTSQLRNVAIDYVQVIERYR
jgi:hypothetical protein